MVNKKVYELEDIKLKILKAVDTITDPIASTLSPKGSNVLCVDDSGNPFYTNDGVTIAKNISVKDEVENAIIEVIKISSLKTNTEVGDGTSSTILASSVLIKEGLRLIENGHNRMDIRDALIKFAESMEKELTSMAIKVKDDKDVKFIAKISASGDDKIAEDVVRITKVVGLDGQVMIDRGFGTETEIIEETGFILKTGAFSPELTNKQFQTNMENVPVLITDKRLYYKSEAETILKTVMNSGYSEVVIIAQDFVGEALPYFIANHINNKIRVILIAEKKSEILEDLAIYLGGEVISDKKGSLVDNVTIEQFMMAKRVFADQFKAIIGREKKEKNKDLDTRVKSLKAEMVKNGNKNDPEYLKLLNRVSSLTNGMVTIKVGGATHPEILERIYRYEDAVNAVRAAMKEGYLPGAGVAVWSAWTKIKVAPDYERMFKRLAQANIRQIAVNCGEIPEIVLDNISRSTIAYDRAGYNANTGKIEDVVKSGIIEPLLVATHVITNAVSIANIILTSKYFVVPDFEDDKENK